MAGFLVILFRRSQAAVLAALVLSAQTASGAWNAGNFLRFGVGARPLAMGNSFVAIADDATAVYWNPAGLSQGNGMEFFVSYTERFGLGIQDASAGLTLPTEKRYRLGMAVIRTSVGDINRATRADANGRPIVSSIALILFLAYALANSGLRARFGPQKP